jgi:hypothetical protein
MQYIPAANTNGNGYKRYSKEDQPHPTGYPARQTRLPQDGLNKMSCAKLLS